MSEITVGCVFCFEEVEWSKLPDHLDDHGGSATLEGVVVNGETQMMTIGEYDPDGLKMLMLSENADAPDDSSGGKQ